MNKRLPPSRKVIMQVRVPRQKHELGLAHEDEEEDEHGSDSVFFDAAYLEVERVIGKRKLEDPHAAHTGKTEYLVKSVKQHIREWKGHSIKALADSLSVCSWWSRWCNLPYDGATWESEELLGEVIPEEAVARFERSLAFPTAKQQSVGQTYATHNQRAIWKKDDWYSEDKPAPEFAGGRQLRSYQVSTRAYLTANGYDLISCMQLTISVSYSIVCSWMASTGSTHNSP